MQFRGKERETRVKDRAKNGVRKRARRVAMVQFFARPKPKIPFLGLFCSETKRKRLLRAKAMFHSPTDAETIFIKTC